MKPILPAPQGADQVGLSSIVIFNTSIFSIITPRTNDAHHQSIRRRAQKRQVAL